MNDIIKRAYKRLETDDEYRTRILVHCVRGSVAETEVRTAAAERLDLWGEAFQMQRRIIEVFP